MKAFNNTVYYTLDEYKFEMIYDAHVSLKWHAAQEIQENHNLDKVQIFWEDQELQKSLSLQLEDIKHE